MHTRSSAAASALIALLAAAAPAAAQQSGSALVLRILAHGTGEALKGAQVRVSTRPLVGLTAADGRVRIDGVPVGEQSVEIVHAGYQTERMTIGFAAGQPVEGEVELLPEPVQLAGLEVRGRRREETVRRASGTRPDLFTREEITAQEPGKRHVGDLLRGRVPGVKVFEGWMKDESGAGGLAAPRVCIQMNRALQQIERRRQCAMVAVYLNGAKIADPGTYLLGLPLNAIESVELLGPVVAGARYGSDAGFGVLEVFTRGMGPYAPRSH